MGIHRRKCAGQTRPEVILLVAILMVLVAFLAVPVHAGTDRSPKFVCMSNIKQLGLGMQMYANDHDDRLPAASTWGNTTWAYVKNDDIYDCPELKRHGATHPYGYAMFTALSMANLAKFSDTALKRQPLVFDSTDQRKSAHGSLASLPSPGRHEGVNCIVFADGHAEGK